MMEKNPLVFISYSHDSQTHLDRILNFSNKLRSEGIDCHLDQYEESPEEGWPRWTDRNISNSEYVLVICTQTYFNRVMGKEEKGIGNGVAWEGNIIYQHLYNSGSLNKKFVPIILEDTDKSFIPTPIAGSSFYHIDKDYEKLYWRLRGVSQNAKPELGKLRELPKKERKTMFISGIIDIELWDKAGWKGVGFIEDPRQEMPPTIAILFKNKEYAEKIFKGLIDRLGEKDEYDELRLSIIEGDDEGEPYGYYVHIGGYVENTHKRLVKQFPKERFELFMMLSRFHRMTPQKTSENLKRFKENYLKYNYFSIIPGILDDNSNIKLMTNFNIVKRTIEFRRIEDIKSENDADAAVLKKFRKKYEK